MTEAGILHQMQKENPGKVLIPAPGHPCEGPKGVQEMKITPCVVSIIGTFAVLLLLGFSINVLTLFGLVLAIGIVVDDAIVVVENIHRHIQLRWGKAKQATIYAVDFAEVRLPVRDEDYDCFETAGAGSGGTAFSQR